MILNSPSAAAHSILTVLIPTMALMAMSLFCNSIQIIERGELQTAYFRYDCQRSRDDLPKFYAELCSREISDELTAWHVALRVLELPKSTIRGVYGAPMTMDDSLNIEGFPRQAYEADENWIYYAGGRCLLLCFKGGTCSSWHRLEDTAVRNYIHWKYRSIQGWVAEKKQAEIQEKFGQFDEKIKERFREETPVRTANGDFRIEVSQWAEVKCTYKIAPDDGIWLGMKDGRCIFAEPFHTWH